MYDSSGKCIFRNVKPFTFVKPPSLQKFERHTHFDVEKGDYDLDKYYVAHKHAPNFNVSQKGNNVLNEIGLPEMYFKADTTYQNKYPKYSKDQEIVQRWQTENGTPNEFNQMMRAEANKIKIEDVENEDSDYKKGLDEVKKMIKGQYKKPHHINMAQKVFDEEASERRKVVQKVPVAKIRPVKIGPAIDDIYPDDDNVTGTNPSKTPEELAKAKNIAAKAETDEKRSKYKASGFYESKKKEAIKESIDKKIKTKENINTAIAEEKQRRDDIIEIDELMKFSKEILKSKLKKLGDNTSGNKEFIARKILELKKNLKYNNE